jgi:transposase
MTAAQNHSSQAASARLFVAFELGWSKIKIASTCDPLQKPRIQEIAARDLAALHKELAKAKKRFGLPEDAAVSSCYEAGRDGFWLHRYLTTQGVKNVVVDPGSLKVNRRRKRAKTDRIDARLLLDNLLDHEGGKKHVWSVVHVPSLEQEDRRQLHRELETLLGERTEHVNRIKSLLATLGLKLEKIDGKFESWLDEQRLLESGVAVPADYRERLLREYRRWQLVNEQVVALEAEQKERVRASPAPGMEKVRKLMRLKGIGVKSAWLFGMEFFGWRTFRNRRQVGALAGLTPTPNQSGEMSKELGINKAGNCWIRSLIVEIAWGWLHWQPGSKLSLWFKAHFGGGTGRSRKKGIVALARKLLIALWRWVEFDEHPEGAVLVDWETKVNVKAKAKVEAKAGRRRGEGGARRRVIARRLF